MRKRTSSLPPPSPRMATFSPAAPRRCVRTCSRVLFLAILCLLGTLVLSLLSSIMRGPRHAPASPYHNASERLNFECPANASYPTYRNHSDLKTENEVLKWMGSRFFEMTYSDVEEVNAPFVPFVPGSDSHRFKAYNDRADSVKEDSAPIPVVNPNADKGNKGEKDAERVFGVKKMMADVNPARNRRDGYSREAEIDLAPGIEGLAEGGMIHRRDEQEKKIMAWHGFGDVAADEDNSENAWRDTDEDWKPRKMQGQKNSWNFGGYDSASNILNSSAVVMEPFKPESGFSNSPRIAYLNGHRGCNENLRGVLGRFRLNFNVVDPRKIAKYGMSRGDARHLVDNGWVQAFCGAVDVIIVADTVPDARGILLSLLEKDESKRCKSKIIIEMTNRFDWLVPDSHDYVNMLRKLIKHPPKNLWWTANNPFEAAFMANQVGMIPNVTLLRSLGAWDVDSQIKTKKSFIQKFLELTGLNWNEVRFRKEIDEAARESLCTIMDIETTTRPKVGDLLDYYCMPIVQLSKKYGGPIGLLKFKGFVHFPYQASVMKFYENVAMGVPQVIPTPRLIRALGKTNNHHLFSTWLDKLEEASLFLWNPDFWKRVYNEDDHTPKDKAEWDSIDKPYYATWTELADFYRKEFEPFVYYFDTFEELAELVKRPADVFDWKNVRMEGPKYYAKVRKQSLETWRRLFHDMGYKVREYN